MVLFCLFCIFVRMGNFNERSVNRRGVDIETSYSVKFLFFPEIAIKKEIFVWSEMEKDAMIGNETFSSFILFGIRIREEPDRVFSAVFCQGLSKKCFPV